MASKDLFGWDLLYRVVENDIDKKEDVLVAFIHWYLIKTGFRCLGLGDDRAVNPTDVQSELLPQGWNKQDKTALRYIRDNEVYILHGIYNEGAAFFNLLRVNGLTVSNVSFTVNDVVSATRGTIVELMPRHNEILENITQSLVNPVFAGASREAETQTPQASCIRPDITDPLVSGRPRSPPGLLAGGRSLNVDLLRDINDAARRDLDPLGLGGQMPGRFDPDGTLGPIDPFHPGLRGRGGSHPGLGIPGGIPRGSVPPGSRFDPFGPPDPEQARPARRPPPDSDHMQPPGFGYDDMFS